jgi:acetyltransferase
VADHDRLTVLLGYLEGLRDGRAFVRAVRAARSAGKDVVLLKVGTSDAGARAAASHTGAMAGSAEAWAAAFRRAGAMPARGPRDLLDIGVALAGRQRPTGARLGIVSMSGGAGVLMADRASELGLSVPELGSETRARLAEVLPGYAALGNPVDYGGAYGDPEVIAATVRAVAESPEVDMVAMFAGLTPELAGAIEAPLAAIVQDTGKPLVVAWLGGPVEGVRTLRALGVPAYDDPLLAVEMAAALHDSARPLPEDPALPEPDASLRDRLRASGRRDLAEHEVKALLADRGVPVALERRVASAAEAAAAAAAFGRPLAIKADAPGLVHKSDAGAVLLDVDPAEAGAAYEQVVAAAAGAGHPADGALVAPMAAAGVELLVGTRWDEQFGPLIVVGAGGVTSEVAHDVQVELAPIDATLAREMLSRLRMAPLLDGFRGAPPADVEAAANAIAAVSRLAADAGDALAELDVNPLRVHPAGEGLTVLDGVAIVSPA